jgi:hypothetical protein
MGAVGFELVPALVPPVPARSCCMQESRSAPIIFSQRLRPPIADGAVTGAGDELTEGVCEGVTAGVCEGVTDGVWDGATAGAGCCVVIGGWPGEVLGAVEGEGCVVCAKAVPAMARRAAALRVLSMSIPFSELG